jgi:hypothetical protein
MLLGFFPEIDLKVGFQICGQNIKRAREVSDGEFEVCVCWRKLKPSCWIV